MGNFWEVNGKFLGSKWEIFSPEFPTATAQLADNQQTSLPTFPTKKNNGKFSRLLAFFLLCITHLATAQGYDKAPEFPGGNPGLEKFLTEKMKYPERARKLEVEGKVMVGFTIDTKGKPVNISILQHVHALLDSEAVRVVRAMPRWQPATKGKVKVMAPVVLPLTFELRDPKKKR